jgi:hypothetical protein
MDAYIRIDFDMDDSLDPEDEINPSYIKYQVSSQTHVNSGENHKKNFGLHSETLFSPLVRRNLDNTNQYSRLNDFFAVEPHEMREKTKTIFVSPISELPSKSFYKEGEYPDYLHYAKSPTGKIVHTVNSRGTLFEIKEIGDAIGKIFEAQVLNFFLGMGINPNDILLPVETSKGLKQGEFSDGVIIFGNTAFLLQAKARSAVAGQSYQEPESFDHLEDKISKAKKQYYSSLEIFRDYGNIMEFNTLSGNKRVITKEDYDWKALIIIGRNYLSSEKKLVYGSRSKSQKIPEEEKVNHIILSLQGMINISYILPFPNQFFAFLKRLSNRQLDYELGHDVLLINKYYSNNYAIDNNSLNFLNLIYAHTAFFFKEKLLTKEQINLMLSPLEKSSDSSFKNLMEKIDIYFNDRNPNGLYVWRGEQRDYEIHFDFNGKVRKLKELSNKGEK